METLGVFERRHVAAMRAVKGSSAVHGRLGIESRVSRRADSAVVRPPRLCATSVASGDVDADEGWTIEDSPRPCQCSLLIEWLVQRFVIATRYVPRTAQRLLASSDLPPALERVAMQAQRCLQTWFAWTDGPRIWFVVTEMATAPDRYRQDRALRMFFYDEEGRFVSWGTWALQSECSWILCER